MPVGTLISVDEYLRTAYDSDCDFIDGEVLERHVGEKKHGFAQLHIGAWFVSRRDTLRLEAFIELRTRISASRIRIPDVVVCEFPVPGEEVFTTPPYLCIEVMSPDDTVAAMQDRLDDYLQFGVPNVWVVDPWRHRGWHVTAEGWAVAADRIMRTSDGRVAMPLGDVLLP
jgi:Uma2 family endonuclease